MLSFLILQNGFNRLAHVYTHTMLFSFLKSSIEPAETYFTEKPLKNFKFTMQLNQG